MAVSKDSALKELKALGGLESVLKLLEGDKTLVKENVLLVLANATQVNEEECVKLLRLLQSDPTIIQKTLSDASSVIQLGGARVIANCTALDPAIAEDGGVDPLSTFVTEECFTVLARLLSSDNVALVRMVTLIFDNVTAESDAKRFKFLTQYASALLPLLAHDDNLVQENALIALSSLSEDNPALATQLLESSEEVIDAFVDVLRDALEPLDDDEEGIGSVEEAALIFLINVITCHAGGATIVQRYGLLEALFKGLVTVQEGVQELVVQTLAGLALSQGKHRAQEYEKTSSSVRQSMLNHNSLLHLVWLTDHSNEKIASRARLAIDGLRFNGRRPDQVPMTVRGPKTARSRGVEAKEAFEEPLVTEEEKEVERTGNAAEAIAFYFITNGCVPVLYGLQASMDKATSAHAKEVVDWLAFAMSRSSAMSQFSKLFEDSDDYPRLVCSAIGLTYLCFDAPRIRDTTAELTVTLLKQLFRSEELRPYGVDYLRAADALFSLDIDEDRGMEGPTSPLSRALSPKKPLVPLKYDIAVETTAAMEGNINQRSASNLTLRAEKEGKLQSLFVQKEGLAPTCALISSLKPDQREIELPKVEYWILELVVRALYRREYGLIWVKGASLALTKRQAPQPLATTSTVEETKEQTKPHGSGRRKVPSLANRASRSKPTSTSRQEKQTKRPPLAVPSERDSPHMKAFDVEEFSLKVLDIAHRLQAFELMDFAVKEKLIPLLTERNVLPMMTTALTVSHLLLGISCLRVLVEETNLLGPGSSDTDLEEFGPATGGKGGGVMNFEEMSDVVGTLLFRTITSLD